MAGEFTRARQARTDHLSKILDIREKLDVREAKRQEFEARRLKAKREVGIAEELDQDAKNRVDLSVAKSLNEMDDITLDNVGKQVSAVTDEATYQQALKNLTPTQKKDFGITGKGYKKEKNRFKYISDRYIHTREQIQALELAEAKAASKGKQPKYTPPPTSKTPFGKELGALQTQLLADPVFEEMGATSDAFIQSSQEVAMRFRDLEDKIKASNNQRAAVNLPPVEFDKTKAFDVAKRQTKEYLYEGIDTTWLGENKLSYMSPQEAKEKEMRWKQRAIQELSQRDPNFLKKLQENPVKVEQALRDMYQKEQAQRMRMDEMRIYGNVNSR